MTYPTFTHSGWRVWTVTDGLQVFARHAPLSVMLRGVFGCIRQ